MLDKNENDKIIFETNISFILKEDENEISSGEGKIQLKETEFAVFPKLKQAIMATYRDVVNFFTDDYKININLSSNETLVIFDLGYKFEDFLRIFSRLYNEVIMKDMLMQETVRKSGVECEMIFIDSSGKEIKYEKCEPRLYETAIVLIPEKGEIKRIPYCDISNIKDENYKIIIETEFSEKIILSMLGKDFEPFLKTLSDIINELSLKVQSSMKELLPSANPSVIRKISNIMKEGKAAKREDIEKISKELWEELENKIIATDIKEEYEFLKSIAEQKKICIGLKRGLLGDLTGEYIWFLIPIYGDGKNYGNAIAMEAISGEEGGKATYFFRIVSRDEYCKLEDLEKLNEKVDAFIKSINRCMLAINFRREPIYLPDEKLKEPQYQKYNYAIVKIPELKKLREFFIGRVIHFSFEQWREDVMDLLKFNINVLDNTKRWIKKGGL